MRVEDKLDPETRAKLEAAETGQGSITNGTFAVFL